MRKWWQRLHYEPKHRKEPHLSHWMVVDCTGRGVVDAGSDDCYCDQGEDHYE